MSALGREAGTYRHSADRLCRDSFRLTNAAGDRDGYQRAALRLVADVAGHIPGKRWKEVEFDSDSPTRGQSYSHPVKNIKVTRTYQNVTVLVTTHSTIGFQKPPSKLYRD
jgi:hypothetical protein